MDPAVNSNNQADNIEVSSPPEPYRMPLEEKPTIVGRNKHLFLFKYITLLATGVSLLALLSISGFTLLEHWLGEPKEGSFVSTYLYSFQLYLLASLVLTAGLHIWMSLVATNGTAEEEELSAPKVFRAIFLVILALTVLGSLGAIAYIVIDMIFGTANYTTKGIWLAMLNPLQVIVWSLLLGWYFKVNRTGLQVAYAGAIGLVTLIVAILLIIFPILSKRDSVIDARTSSDLTTITAGISKYTAENNKLPSALNDIRLDDERVKTRLGSYEYQITQAANEQRTPTDLSDFFGSLSQPRSSGFTYKLCANFKTDTTKDEDGGIIPLLTPSPGMRQHPQGKHCFDQAAYGKQDSSSEGDALRGNLGQLSS